MELLYVWIDNYRNINRKGFNFDSEYIFELEENERAKTAFLRITPNTNHFPYFFGDNISGVTAIVGKNGSGKSSIIDFILSNFAVDPGTTNTHTVAVFRINPGKLAIYYNIDKRFRYTRVKGIEISSTRNGTENGKLLSLVYPMPMVYLSNSFQGKWDYYNGAIDISTEYLLNNDSRDLSHRDETSQLEAYRSQETLRQLTYIKSGRAKLPDFSLPEDATLNVMDESPKLIRDLESGKRKPKYLQGLLDALNKDIEQKVKERQSVIIDKRLIRLHFLRASLANLYRNVPRAITNSVMRKFIESRLNKISDSDIEDIVAKVISKASERMQKRKKNTGFGEMYKQFNLIIQKEKFAININNAGFTAHLPLNKLDNFIRIYTSYNQLLWRFTKGINVPLLNFQWQDLSTGQQAYLSVFARLYDAHRQLAAFKARIRRTRSSHYITGPVTTPHINIFIDEGDTYFHPQWQKSFFKNIKDFVSELFPRQEVRLVFATHSPFLVSDLPKSNIIFLKNENDECEPAELENQRETFGANIHTLFTNSFFMQGGLIGEFAKDKINEVFTWLNPTNKNKYNRNYYLQIIDMVGDPIVQARLREMYGRKMGIDLEEQLLNAQRQEIELRLKAIQQERKGI